MTIGEIQDFVNCVKERNRRYYQNLSIIACKEAELVSRFCFSKKAKDIKVYEEFPYWEESEINEIKWHILKAQMLANAVYADGSEVVPNA